MSTVNEFDVILVGSGIMSATLGAILKRLDPTLSIRLYEAGPSFACEASDGWNNAGTGHAGICELSYTPHREPDGSVNVRKAIEIYAQFAQSLEFWGFAVRDGMIDRPSEFITSLPHVSFVHGEKQVEYLRARFEALSRHHFFRSMAFSTDRAQITEWAPLLTAGRGKMPIAATRMEGGTDVNFGAIARKLIEWLGHQLGCEVHYQQLVTSLARDGGGWRVVCNGQTKNGRSESRAKFLFLGAGGGTLPLLQKSGIPEAQGIGGFPIGGQWLVCTNPRIVDQHFAKVYGQALGAAPTMAIPHLDTRILDGKRALLFGPFAAWTTKFLRNTGRWTDLPTSIRLHNWATLGRVALDNVDLVRYLIQQGMQGMSDRIQVLSEFYPAADAADWKLIDAGIRVQAIKKTDATAGIVHYGTEVIASHDNTIAALLGASPGASVSVNVALEVIAKCLPNYFKQALFKERLCSMVASYFDDVTNPALADESSKNLRQAETSLLLGR